MRGKLLNIRMRASRKKKGRDAGEVHISGAEGIYENSERLSAVQRYVARALSHPKGSPDSIVVSIEEITHKPRMIRALPIRTVKCRSAVQAEGIMRRILGEAGVSVTALSIAERVLNEGRMRGASLVSASSGKRLEHDKARGVRASRLGITAEADRSLSRRLARQDIRTTTVKEAVILASKVAACPSIIGEVCVSDDPDYTTGYVSSREFGYIRIPHIKRKGSRRGGRVFFVEEGSHVEDIREFLEDMPVMVNEAGRCGGTFSIDEIISADM